MKLEQFDPEKIEQKIRLPQHFTSDTVRTAHYLLLGKTARGSTIDILKRIKKYLNGVIE